MNNIDLNKFKEIEQLSIFNRLEDSLNDFMDTIPNTRSRAIGAINFASKISTNTNEMNLNEFTTEVMQRESFFRASLAEFISMEETFKRETSNKLDLNKTGNPLLIILKELRNLEMHLTSNTINEQTGLFEIHLGDEVLTHEGRIFYLEDLSLNSFDGLNNLKYYDKADFEKAINLVDIEQKKWGIASMLVYGVQAYCHELKDL